MRDEPQLGISRLDLYCDLQGWSPVIDDLDRFHCRGARRRAHPMPAQDRAHVRGRRPSGFVLGGSDLMASCCHETLELRAWGAGWRKAASKDSDRQNLVWRAEFQSHRCSLVSRGYSTCITRRGEISTDALRRQRRRPTAVAAEPGEPDGHRGRCPTDSPDLRISASWA